MMEYIGNKSLLTQAEAGFRFYQFDNRNNIRLSNPASGDLAIIERLGMFRFIPGDQTPDDDKTCFATASGRWLIDLVTWEYVQTQIQPWQSTVETNISQVQNALINIIAYNDRANLRTIPGVNNQLALIDTLGLYKFTEGGTDTDDDMTCFVSTNGTWNIEAIAPAVAQKLIQQFAPPPASSPVKMKIPMLSLGLRNVAANTVLAYSFQITGVDVTDFVLVNNTISSLACWGIVSAAGTVTIYVANTTTKAIDGSSFQVGMLIFSGT